MLAEELRGRSLRSLSPWSHRPGQRLFLRMCRVWWLIPYQDSSVTEIVLGDFFVPLEFNYQKNFPGSFFVFTKICIEWPFLKLVFIRGSVSGSTTILTLELEIIWYWNIIWPRAKYFILFWRNPFYVKTFNTKMWAGTSISKQMRIDFLMVFMDNTNKVTVIPAESRCAHGLVLDTARG